MDAQLVGASQLDEESAGLLDPPTIEAPMTGSGVICPMLPCCELNPGPFLI